MLRQNHGNTLSAPYPQGIAKMKKIIHLAFWLVLISAILILLYSHVVAGDAIQAQRNALADRIKADVTATVDFL
jgi:hypothetical protein